MKVGTDAVLLGGWVNVSGAKRILDIGTGCGIIALMIAQRANEPTTIDAIESEEADATQATKNFLNSRWANRVKVFHQPLQEFKNTESYDLIVSNPPYFTNSQLPPTAHRAKARHTHSLNYQELLKYSVGMLTKKGRLAVVLPVEEGNQFVFLAKDHGLFCVRQLAFYSRKEKPQERWLFEFSAEEKSVIQEMLVLHGEGESWSGEYKRLTKEFYLKL